MEELAKADEVWKAKRTALRLPLKSNLDDLDPGEIVRDQRESSSCFSPRRQFHPHYNAAFPVAFEAVDAAGAAGAAGAVNTI